ncbi:DsrE family protein [Hydrogenibacillus schlegelii]|uniref:Uncharacterized protein n=1 Tax=Hydrogenibacillus schlegelii TaxID=1484 RepID=A0A179IR83_HYDSH|nr:DsrE family protein [Hydrogenibacillus schlegelii]OAR05188.1 hypothetical protein SA87_05310 [Hydrogenibacillus schlegelii]PTQ51336.1 MAG: hypothetical protein HSCHL_1376 [Hydrogenibacillus schlegelii]
MTKLLALILSGPDEKMKVISGLRVAQRIKEMGGEARVVFLADGVRVPLEGANDPDFSAALESVKDLESTVCKGILEQMGVQIEPLELKGFNVDYVGPILARAAEEGFQIVSF